MSIVYGPKWPFYSCWDYIALFWTGICRYCTWGRALRTKETLPDFLKWRQVTRHPLVFRGLTGSQQTPGFGASQYKFILFLLSVNLVDRKHMFLSSNLDVVYILRTSHDEKLD